MIRMHTRLGIVLAGSLAAAGCTTVVENPDAPDVGSDKGADAGSGDSSASSPSGDASGPGGASIPFAPSNVPSDAPLSATGDWVFSTGTCGSGTVTLHTTTGEVSCGNQPAGSFAFKTITQPDTSFGELTAGLFVTNNLRIEPNMTIKVVGNRPLLIAVLGTAKIEGTIRASILDRNLASGGGHDGSASETRGNGPGGGQGGLNGGAGGGGHCGVGGAGGKGAGGKAYGKATNIPLLGGSSGGGAEARGGAGGGAIQIVAGGSIEVSGLGLIDVAGGGGSDGDSGGGAGGAMLLEAPVVSVFGTLAANGGAGAGSERGGNGSADNVAAKGGTAGFSWLGIGGDGGADTSIDGKPGIPTASAHPGGGGGGVGRIRINTQSGSAKIGPAAVISPALTTPCATQGTLRAR